MVEEMAEQQQTQSTEETQQPGDGTQEIVVNKPSNEYVKELTKEKTTLDPSTHSVAMKLLDEGKIYDFPWKIPGYDLALPRGVCL
ncbi:hypothetical protein GE061_002001 [Apolygus lucorum]|uniref:Uncharacterized protein n=1 Tax=Apolygus lucorum TaxID=248454 RepID=A0A8S9X5B0_APOLU|nr:hypothetical protein GE061_002001 [Apolygus lucorum]